MALIPPLLLLPELLVAFRVEQRVQRGCDVLVVNLHRRARHGDAALAVLDVVVRLGDGRHERGAALRLRHRLDHLEGRAQRDGRRVGRCALRLDVLVSGRVLRVDRARGGGLVVPRGGGRGGDRCRSRVTLAEVLLRFQAVHLFLVLGRQGRIFGQLEHPFPGHHVRLAQRLVAGGCGRRRRRGRRRRVCLVFELAGVGEVVQRRVERLRRRTVQISATDGRVAVAGVDVVGVGTARVPVTVGEAGGHL